MQSKKVPFFPNTQDNTHCLQAVVASILRYYDPNANVDFAYLDKLTDKSPDKWTWTYRLLCNLAQMGYDVLEIEDFDHQQFIKNPDAYLIEKLGVQAGQASIDNSNLKQEVINARDFVQKVKYENRPATLDNIAEYLQRGYLIGCHVNSRKLRGRTGYYGHFILVYGYDIEDQTLTIHDPGIYTNLEQLYFEAEQMPLEQFLQGWSEYPNIIAVKKLLEIKKDL